MEDRAVATRLPAEWEPQAAVMMTWPHPDGDWREHHAEAERCFAQIAAAVTRHQDLIVACRDREHLAAVASALDAAGAASRRAHLYTVPADDCWARDHGPITVYRGGRPRLLHFRFDGWGGRYRCERDAEVTAVLHRLGAFGPVPQERVDMVLEGGSIECDGRGTLLTTRRCLAARAGAGFQPEPLARRLRALLGVRRVLWLQRGHLAGDDTGGHIDTLARFCDPATIAYQGCEDPGDEHHAELGAMARELAALRTAGGAPYRLVPLPLPRPIAGAGGRRLPAGYANFLVINGAVLVPTYEDPADAVALRRLAGCFPGRRVAGIPCRALIRQFGSLHCVTMQLPAGVPVARG